MLRLNNSNLPFGLDISDLSIKIVQLREQRDKIKIQAIGRCDVKPGIIENGEIKDPEKFNEILTKLIAKPTIGSITTNEVVCNLPSNQTFIKLIEVDKSPNPLSSVIENEVEKHIPSSVNDLYYDWQVIEEGHDSYEIIIGAAPKNIVDHYINILKKSKLNPLAFDLESVAVCRSLLKEEAKKYEGKYNKNYCLIDIGANTTNMTIYTKNTVVLSISLPLSNDDVTNKIAKSLEIDKEQAEKAKIICGFDKTRAHGIVSGILSDMLKTLNQKLDETIKFYQNHYAERGGLDQIILSGGGATIKDIGKTFNELTGIDTLVGDPFINLKGFDRKEIEILNEIHDINPRAVKEKRGVNTIVKKNNHLTYTTAIGLALRNVFINIL